MCSVFLILGHISEAFVCVSLQGGVGGGPGEVWLVLTDPSLQEDEPQRPRRRTLALCISAACVLTSSVVRALRSSAGCRVSFRDVVREHGRSVLRQTPPRDVQITLTKLASQAAWPPHLHTRKRFIRAPKQKLCFYNFSLFIVMFFFRSTLILTVMGCFRETFTSHKQPAGGFVKS